HEAGLEGERLALEGESGIADRCLRSSGAAEDRLTFQRLLVVVFDGDDRPDPFEILLWGLVLFRPRLVWSRRSGDDTLELHCNAAVAPLSKEPFGPGNGTETHDE